MSRYCLETVYIMTTSYRDACLPSDHYTSPRAAYELIKPFVPTHVTLYDPWFDDGACAAVMREVFDTCTVIHEDRDALTWTPHHDVIVGNPPFSNKYFWLQWLLDSGKPWAVILPMTTLVALKFHALRGRDRIQVVLPSRRIHYERGGKVVKGCAFDSVFITAGLDLPRDIVWGGRLADARPNARPSAIRT